MIVYNDVLYVLIILLVLYGITFTFIILYRLSKCDIDVSGAEVLGESLKHVSKLTTIE